MLHLPTLILQIAIIVAVARLFGWLFRHLHQPQVIGEMIAGIALGPSLLGWMAPSISTRLFPTESLVALNSVSQVGILLFLFLIGLELNLSILGKVGRSAVVTSLTSVIAPFILGFAVAFYLHAKLSDTSVNAINFSIFIGAAMSVTAFPVLARILIERRLFHTRIGTIAIASAAVDDVMAWCFLAIAILLVRGQGLITEMAITITSLLAFLAVMILVIRPLLRRLASSYKKRGEITQGVLAIVVLVLLASALMTEWIGIHALFGAFIAGAIMPKDEDFARDLPGKFQDITVVLFLPIFFAFTGLKTSINLLSGANLWGYCLLIIATAITGKLGGAMFAARATGLEWREAGAVGILLNTRGLMELVILTIGLDAKIISPTVFTMMVLMALLTTAITTPLLQLIYQTPETSEEVLDKTL
jgi:Kef-type K+ transport system membrane component KefB